MNTHLMSFWRDFPTCWWSSLLRENLLWSYLYRSIWMLDSSKRLTLKLTIRMRTQDLLRSLNRTCSHLSNWEMHSANWGWEKRTCYAKSTSSLREPTKRKRSDWGVIWTHATLMSKSSWEDKRLTSKQESERNLNWAVKAREMKRLIGST